MEKPVGMGNFILNNLINCAKIFIAAGKGEPMKLCINDCISGRVIIDFFSGLVIMSNQVLRQAQDRPRVTRVLVVLLVSMTTGAVVLMALGNHPPSAGPFCLSTYYRLDPIQQAIDSRVTQVPGRWESVEIYFSGTKAGNIDQLSSLSGLANSDDINCHFVICNGLGGNDGQILTSEKWQKQWSVIPDHTWYGSSRTIRVCLVADGKTVKPTNSQIKRAEALVETLSMKFNIPAAKIFYPNNWR